MRAVDGPLALVVRHPADGDPIPPTGRDYVMGSTGSGRATVTVNADPVPVQANGSFLAYLPAPRDGYVVRARLGDESARVAIMFSTGITSAPPSASSAPVAGDVAIVTGGAAEIPARAEATGDYSWSLLPGTRGTVTGVHETLRQVRFAGGAAAWVDGQFVAASREAPRSFLASMPRVEARAEETDLVIPAPEPLAYGVTEGDSDIAITVYGLRAAKSGELAAAGYATRISFDAPDSAALRVRLALRGPAYGYEVVWSRGAMVLRVRHPPPIDARRPLAGLAIVVDAGHPPGGAVGPTGIAEPEVTLDVARRLATLLASRGARVVMTRTDAGAVSLDRRVAMARASGAHAFVSIHADAVASGADPSRDIGTAVFASRPHSMGLARAVSRALVPQLGLPDRGVRAGDYAVVRPTWLPAILCEGATLTDPAQEAALADSTFRAAYASGVAKGIEAYFGDLLASSHIR